MTAIWDGRARAARRSTVALTDVSDRDANTLSRLNPRPSSNSGVTENPRGPGRKLSESVAENVGISMAVQELINKTFLIN